MSNKTFKYGLIVAVISFSLLKLVYDNSFAQPYQASAVPTCPLVVTISGTGSGSVNSKPCGVASTEGTRSIEFPVNSMVTLFATPDANSTFAGWTGDCSNTMGDCVVTMETAKTVTALFDAGPFIRTTGAIGRAHV